MAGHEDMRRQEGQYFEEKYIKVRVLNGDLGYMMRGGNCR